MYIYIYIYMCVCVCVCVRLRVRHSMYFEIPYHQQNKIFLAVKEILSLFVLRKYLYKNTHFVGSMPNILGLSKCVLLLLFLEGKKKL
jgi:hypothetical protein